ncbi:hypothetical protein, partial [Enterobacter hormaechei]
PAYGLSCFSRVALTLTRPTVRGAVAVGAHRYQGYGTIRFCRVAVTHTRAKFRYAVAGCV